MAVRLTESLSNARLGIDKELDSLSHKFNPKKTHTACMAHAVQFPVSVGLIENRNQSKRQVPLSVAPNPQPLPKSSASSSDWGRAVPMEAEAASQLVRSAGVIPCGVTVPLLSWRL